ncbi:MAG: efflux RND transporter permease subunit [Polyangia bacterium]|jgi:multidrug efflux pump subunit AcrB|nr:efflux RND transporter permease subunit [Polyangia bacterium]
MKFVVSFSIRQPVLVNLLTVGILIGGLVAWNRMPREIFPTLDRNVVVITTLYPGVAPEEVEQLVSIPIERSIATVDDIESIVVQSSEGRSIITVEMKDGIKDPNRVFLDVQSAVARVSDLPADLPADPSLRGIRRQIAVMWLTLSAALPEKELRALANDLNSDLEEIPGVSEALVYGIRKVQITILVDPVRLAAAGSSIAEVMSAVKRKHVDVSGGSIRTERGEYLLRTVGRFQGADAVRHIVLKAGPRGVVTVGDVASVTEGFEEATQESRVFGTPSVYAVVFKKEEADAVRVAAAVRAYLDRTKDRYPEGSGVRILWDSSVHIERRQKTMYENGLMGLALVIVLLFVFLDWRMAFLTALGIPVAFFGTFIVMHWVFGITMNMMSMFGLIMVLGMLVDDAIIVVENFYRHLMAGKTRLMAALLGCREVVWPVIAAVSTTVVAYLMLVSHPGRMGQMLSSLPKVAAAALMVSVLEALFILPSHLREFAKRPKDLPPTTREEEAALLKLADSGELEARYGPRLGEEEPETREARWFLGMQAGFRWLLGGLTRFWYVSLPAMMVVMALVGGQLLKQTPFRPFPQTTIDQFDIVIELAVGTKLERTVQTVSELEKALARYPKDAVESYLCDVGRVGMGRRQARYGTHLAKCEVRLAKDGKGSISGPALMARLRPVVAGLPLLEKFEFSMHHGGPDAGEPIQLEVRGNDDRIIRRIADEIVAHGTSIPGVEDLRTDWEAGKRELRVKVDEERAARLGLDVATIGLAVRNAFGGGLAVRLQRGEDEIDVVVRFPDDLRQKTLDVESLLIRAPSGAMVPFRAVAELEEGVGPSVLTRVDRKRTITVYGGVDEKVISAERANRLLEKFTSGLRDRYPGYSVRQKGEQEESRKF